jgi:peptidoglycan/LPS O-acetylase OafA/YrhL
MSNSSSSNYYPPLTGIRAIAAYLLFAYHFNPFSPEHSVFLFHFINEWHIGVSLFFVLSGFLIAMRYEGTSQRFQWRSYLLHRFARIFPLFLILTTFTFLYNHYLGSVPFDFRIYLANITLVKGFVEPLLFTGIAQGWSLTVEECFYVAAPAIFWLSQRISLLLQPIILFCGALTLAAVFSDSTPLTSFPVLYTFLGRSFEFYTGIFLAHQIKKNNRPIVGYTYTMVAIVLILATVLVTTYLGIPLSDSLHHPLGVILNLLVMPICFALLLFGLVREKTWLSKVLSADLMQWLGKSSYAFYLIHIGVFQMIISKYLTDQTVILFAILNILAFALYYFIERPIQRWLTKSIR